MKRIAFLGPTGTVSHESAAYFFRGMEAELIPYTAIANVFQATLQGRTDYSVVPIENTIEGSVRLHMDYLINESDLPIQAEWVYPSVQNLIGFSQESGDLRAVRKIVSIDVAVAQCQKFLKEKLPDVEYEYVSSTAHGIRTVMESKDPSIAAIGTRLGADYYGLDVLAENITDHDNNFTRFVLVGSEKLALPASELLKTTIIVTLPEDFPGALHQVLSCFAWRRINLSKIESRPTKKRLGNYYFYIDLESALDSVLLPAALAEIEALGCQVRILGSYPSYTYSETANSEV
jgi:prephenate dehydratase